MTTGSEKAGMAAAAIIGDGRMMILDHADTIAGRVRREDPGFLLRTVVVNRATDRPWRRMKAGMCRSLQVRSSRRC